MRKFPFDIILPAAIDVGGGEDLKFLETKAGVIVPKPGLLSYGTLGIAPVIADCPAFFLLACFILDKLGMV